MSHWYDQHRIDKRLRQMEHRLDHIDREHQGSKRYISAIAKRTAHLQGPVTTQGIVIRLPERDAPDTRDNRLKSQPQPG